MWQAESQSLAALHRLISSPVSARRIVLRPYFSLIATFAVCSQMTACSPVTPSTADAVDAVTRELVKYGEVLKVEKTNGQAKQIGGVESYVVQLRGGIKATDLMVYRWSKNARYDLAGKYYTFSREKSKNHFTESIQLPTGTVMVREFNVTFSKTERGWKFEKLEMDRFGWCPPAGDKISTVEACFSEHKLGA